MNEYLYETRKDYEMIRDLNVNDREIESIIYGWTRDDKESEIDFFAIDETFSVA